jgi:hypothetical protein
MAKEIKKIVKIPRAKITQIVLKFQNASRYKNTDVDQYIDQIVTVIKEANKK